MYQLQISCSVEEDEGVIMKDAVMSCLKILLSNKDN